MINFKAVKTLLINVDMVNGFIKSGAMHDRGIGEIVDAQIDLIESRQSENDCLAFVVESHASDSAEFAKFPKHCIAGTEEAEIVDELKPYAKQAQIYKKNCTSAIFAPNFIEDVAKMVNLQEVIIMGCCTDICVLNLAIPLTNYFDQLNKAVKVIVPKNVVQTFNSNTHNRQEYNEIAFKLMSQAGISVVEQL